MSKIYEEALLDAKKIRSVAEHAAKERIMETITPQIRQMINDRILFEQEELEDGGDLYGDELDAVPEDSPLQFDNIVDQMPDVDLDDELMDQAAADAAISVFAAGDVNIEVEQDDDDDEDELMTDTSLSEVFAKLIRDDFVPDKGIARRVERLAERVRKLKRVMSVLVETKLSNSQKDRLELSFISLVKEGVSLQHDLKHSERGSQRLEQKLNSTIKEMREMSGKYKRNIFDFLFEAEEDKKNETAHMKELHKELHGMREQDDAEIEEEEVEVDVEGAEEDVDVEAASVALEDLGDALGLDLEIADEEGEEEDLEDEDEGDDEGEEMDLGEMDKMEEVYEVNEAALRRELKRMRRKRLREQEEAKDADPYLDHGGEEVGDLVLDIDEDDLINALADELGTVATVDTTPGAAPAAVAESRRRSRRARKTPALRRAIREAAQYKRAATQLKTQLVEMNLFNAKLLYANKLLQNKSLSVKQQRAIVEALDNAKTLREAKLLYKSLSDSLARRGRSGKSLSESVRRTLGSSSRSTRSGSSAKNGVETDRWAVLAGISKN